MFGRNFKPAKCKTALRLAISRIKLLKNKREMQLKQMRRDLAQLLQSGQEPSARIRVEHIMREQNIIRAYEFIELFCELVVARLPIIESQKNCPNDLLEAIASLIFAAPRCADIPELSEIRSHFGLKYGKEFVASAAELRPECGVNRTIIEKLSARAPGGEEKLKVMKEIAKEHQIEWDPSEAEEDLFKPSEDLLNGPSKFVGATQILTQPKKESYQTVSGMPSIEDSQSEKINGMDSSVSSGNVEQKPTQAPASEKSMKATDLHQENLEKRPFHSLSFGKRNTLTPRSTPGHEYVSSQQSASYKIDQAKAPLASSNTSNEFGASNSEDWTMNFKDAASAAQAAAYSAEKASEAAKAAAELLKHNAHQKKDTRKSGATPFSLSSSDEETIDLNHSRLTRRSSSNEHVQPENQPLHGNDSSGRHYVENHTENAVSHHSVSWQSSQQEVKGEIDIEHALPMKSIIRLESYQWPSDEITDDDTMPSRRKSASIRRERRQYIDSKEEMPYAKKDSDFSNSVDGSRPWKTDTMTSHSNNRPSEDFYDSFNGKSESADELESKRPEDNRNIVTEFPLFDGSPHGGRSDIKWSPQKSEQASVVKTSTGDEAHDNLYQSNPAFQAPTRPPPGVPESSKSHVQYSFSNKNRPLDKVSTPLGNASYDSSSSDDDMNNSRMRGKPTSNDLMQSAKWSFSEHDRSGWHSAETPEKIGKAQRKVHHQNEIANDGNGDDVSMKRTIRTDLYHQPSNRVYHDGNKPLENKSQPFRREQEDQINSVGTNRQQTNILKSVEEPRSREGNTVNEEPLSRKGNTVDLHSHQPSNRVYQGGNKPFENKSQPFRREQEDQINSGGTNKQQADIRKSVEEPLSRKGNTVDSRSYQPSKWVYHDGNKPPENKSQPFRVEQEDQINSGGTIRRQIHNSVEEPLSRKRNAIDSHSNTRASDIFADSDSVASDSDEETELEAHNDNSINIHRPPLFSNSSHGTSSNSKHENPKHTEKVSTSTLSSINGTRVHLSQPNPQFQPPKQSLSGLTASSEGSSQIPSSAGESKAQRENSSRRATHVHPKLPDYDDLAAKFASLKKK